VKVTGGAALARWDRALVGVWLCRGAAELSEGHLTHSCCSTEDKKGLKCKKQL
jgi:hypothetical protein